MKIILLLLLFSPFSGISQISGRVLNSVTSEPVYGAAVIASNGTKIRTDFDGVFSLSPKAYPVTLIISAQTFENDTITVDKDGALTIELVEIVQTIETVVVSAGRRKQELESVSISMEVLRPELFENKGSLDLEEAVDQSPGVFAMDGQVSIRGGSGFAYGAGSRVLLLWNGIPIISGDAGDTKWNTIPIECASQIEIIKGASSVLYGSGALNGIISLTERQPGVKGEFRAKIQGGFYDSPKRSTLKWWSKTPTVLSGDAYYGIMKKKFGYTVSINGFTSPGFKEGAKEERGRLSGTLFFRSQKFKRLKMGMGYNVQFQETGNFIIWESDTFAYTPSGGADLTDPASTLTVNTGLSVSVDPYIKVYDKKNNLHSLKTRYYFIDRTNLTNAAQSTSSGVLYADYQFQRKFALGTVMTAGVTAVRTDVKSNLFGDHFSNNYSVYAQFEKRIGKLDITGGVRAEYFEQDDLKGDSDFYFGSGPDTSSMVKLPIYPIIRIGAHYPLLKYTHIRASFGQGIRYPSVAERYTQTSVGALNIFPNQNLRPETGWAAEIGIKQVVKLGKNWKGLFDVAGFINEYNNMMEFTFGTYKPDSIAWSVDPNDVGYIANWFGFQAQNAEKARISGLEISFNSQGKIGEVELTSLIGYTYMKPISLNSDSAYLTTFSDTGTTVLKYRFSHLAKADIEATWKKISLGASARYNSYMTNIDRTFVNGIDVGGTNTQILTGLKEYRDKNNSGSLVFDARIGYNFKEHYRVGFIVNNFLNTEYVTRPGDVQAPRTFMVQLQLKF